MKITQTSLQGAWIVDLEPLSDERGFFARSFCGREFEEHGLNPLVAQANISYNHHKGTIRGLHFQFPPAAECKLVRCTRGAILDVIVDVRPESPTFLSHFAVELSAENRRGLYVPERFAHGYQVLEDGSETTYQVGQFYTPIAESGLRHSDPLLAIRWPLPVTKISEKDRSWPFLTDDARVLRARLAVRPLRVVQSTEVSAHHPTC